MFYFHLSLLQNFTKNVPNIRNSFILEIICARQRSVAIALFVEHPPCNILKMKSFLLLIFFFNLSLLIHIPCVKVIYSGCFRCSAKEAVI